MYERITPGLGDLGWDVFLRALARATRLQRRQVAKALGLRVRDVRAIAAVHNCYTAINKEVFISPCNANEV